MTATDPGRVTRLSVRRARTGAVTLTATLAGRATGATGLLFRGAALVRRLAAARAGTVTLGLGRLAPGAYRVTLAPRDPATSAVRGTRTATFTVPAAARPAGAQRAGGRRRQHGRRRLPPAPPRRSPWTRPPRRDPPGPSRATRRAAGWRRGSPVCWRSGRRVARAVEARLGDLAAAAAAAGGATLSPGGATSAPLPAPRRGTVRATRVAGRGPRAAALRAALAAQAANAADAAALARVLGVAAARVRAAGAAGDLAGVAQGLRDAGLVAPSLGDVIARRPALRHAVARAAARAGTRVPAAVRNPALDRRDLRLAAGLRRFATLG